MLKLTVEKNAGGKKLFSLLFALHCYFIKSFFPPRYFIGFFSLPDCNKINMHNFAIAFTLMTLNVFGAEAHHQTHLLNPEVLINTLHS